MKRGPKDIMPRVIALTTAIRMADNGSTEIAADTLRQVAGMLLDMIDVTEHDMIHIPANTMKTRCQSCGRSGYWAEGAKGGKVLVDCRPTGCIEPSAADKRDGQGIAHFATCPDARQWREYSAKQALAIAERKSGVTPVAGFGDRDRGLHGRG